jgi:DNA invertase Pin-like site-specific DNA recombinase
MQHLVTLVERLRADSIGFKSITDGAIDTTTALARKIHEVQMEDGLRA